MEKIRFRREKATSAVGMLRIISAETLDVLARDITEGTRNYWGVDAAPQIV